MEGSRTSARDRKGPESYNEDALEAHVNKREEKLTFSAGGNFMKYSAPMDPPGMKSTAYVCKHPAMKGPTAEVYISAYAHTYTHARIHRI
jgi:hypothetical protein